MDINPPTIATFNPKEATLERFCKDIVDESLEIKKLQRKADRKLMIANPQNNDEKLSYKAFQKMYGKFVGAYAPASFSNHLKDKLKLLAGKYQEINTYKTKLFQTYIFGSINKKETFRMYALAVPLVQRFKDIYSLLT